jgi:hypothetical protein
MFLRLVKRIIQIIQKIFVAKNRVKDIGIITIGEGSIVNGTIYMQEDCFLQIGNNSMLRGSIVFDKPNAQIIIGERP